MGHPVIVLSVFTLIAVLLVAGYQWRSVRNSQAKRGETPGETTMTRHASRDAATPPDTRVASGGDVTSFKRQDDDAAVAESRGEKPVIIPPASSRQDAA